MAVFEFVPIPSGITKKSTIANTSTSEIVLGFQQIFKIVTDLDCFIRFGVSGMSAASASDFYIPAKTPMTWDLGNQFDRVRVFSAATSPSANVYIQQISRS